MAFLSKNDTLVVCYCKKTTTMIFTSYFKNEILCPYLPNVGDVVTYNVPSRRRPETIKRRFVRRNTLGSIYVELKESRRKLPIEVIQYWPQVGDIVDVSAMQYLDWRVQVEKSDRSRISLPHKVHGLMKILNVDGQISHIKPIKGDDIGLRVPTSILRVVEIMGVRAKDASRVVRALANPEKVKPDMDAVADFEARQQELFQLLETVPNV